MWNGQSSREREGIRPASGPVQPERRTAAWIGASVIVKGEVICSEDLTIDGTVEGTIEVGDHGLTIGEGAGIRAELVAKTITISGAVTGNVTATDRVELCATGSVDGDITARRFLMADGARLRGRVATGNARPRAVADGVSAPEANEHALPEHV